MTQPPMIPDAPSPGPDAPGRDAAPVWQAPERGPHRATRGPALVVGATMLAIGLAAGAAVTAAVGRGGGGTATLVADTSPIQGGGGTAVSVAHSLGPAVGTVIARRGGAGQGALGSGFVIAHDQSHSYLLTNNHVVGGGGDLHLIMPGGRNLHADVVGTDAFDDLAVLGVDDTSLPVAVFGSSAQLAVGQQVVAIGSPLGNEGSVTSGVVSALHRTIKAGAQGSAQSEDLQDVLQTDASINPGNSGGPLADTEGRVVGVNVAIAGNASNIGFSIPSDLAESVARDLIAQHTVRHPFLGIKYMTAIDATQAGQGFDGAGVLVTDVQDGSPAASAGFHANDILQKVDDVAIDNGQTLGGLIQRHHVGDAVHFTLRRGSQQVVLTATLSDRPHS